ncbi:hypothetical protein [Herminiimonas fonticola]|uniref:Lipoprotein n=1 Tax=Herminiimonas fonticola TaxID=303380 RepID=A0A4R6G864_9BURK|nr:hypothetical protein [Herminiimonas fonticola]RBA23975.1 hypothetical protein Hfont_1787 [Herminiimonas fonticola]TDN89975.1 hypothetical protein EV677_2045 [Herminiimonas fonticola]
MKLMIKTIFSNKSLSAAALVFAVSMLGGCAAPSTSKGMTPDSIKTTNKHAKSVSVNVAGGKETDKIGKSQIADTAFSQALVDSINNSKTFSSVIQGKGADYLLTVSIFNIDQPSFGFSFTVKMEAGWSLQRADTGAVVWQESIKSEHTATTSDAFAGVERLRLANEGAAKNNISQGLSKISALKL